MKNPTFLKLQASEMAVAQMASSIYSAYVASGVATDGDEDILIEKAVRAAIKIAVRTDDLVKTDEEWMKRPRPETPVSL